MASNTPKNNRPDEVAALLKLSDGLTKHAQTITQLVIGGVTMARADIQARLQVRIDEAKAVAATKATWQNAVKTDKNARAQAKTFVSGLKQTLLVAFAGQIDALADFGLTPRKVPVVTPEKKAAAALKAKATREARNTMGKVQKAKVKGAVTITPAKATPIATASAPVTAAAPAPATAPAPAPAPTTATAPVTASAPAPAPAPAPVTAAATHPLP